MRRSLATGAMLLGFLFLSAPAHAGHGLKSWIKSESLDHPFLGGATAVPPAPVFQSGGPGASWELVASIPTGNPHTDIDFFTQGGETFASVGRSRSGRTRAGRRS